MQLDQNLKRHRFPLSIISQAVWLYHRFNHSYRDIQGNCTLFVRPTTL
jgi:putative transposase